MDQNNERSVEAVIMCFGLEGTFSCLGCFYGIGGLVYQLLTRCCCKRERHQDTTLDLRLGPLRQGARRNFGFNYHYSSETIHQSRVTIIRPPINDRQTSAAIREPSTNDHQSSGETREPSTNDRQSSGGIRQLSTNDLQSSSGTRELSTNDLQSSSGTREPSTNDRQSSGGIREPSTNDRHSSEATITSSRNNRQSSGDIREPSRNDRQPYRDTGEASENGNNEQPSNREQYSETATRMPSASTSHQENDHNSSSITVNAAVHQPRSGQNLEQPQTSGDTSSLNELRQVDVAQSQEGTSPPLNNDAAIPYAAYV